MKKRLATLLLAVILVISSLPGFIIQADTKAPGTRPEGVPEHMPEDSWPDPKDGKIHVKTKDQLLNGLGYSNIVVFHTGEPEPDPEYYEKADLILEKDIVLESGEYYVAGFNVIGEKTLDLNGHTIKIDNARSFHYPHVAQLKKWEDGSDQLISAAQERTAITVNEGSSFVIYDSSKKQNGSIQHFANIESLYRTSLGNNGMFQNPGLYEINASFVRNAVKVKNDGKLVLLSGSIIAGRSKQQWMTTARDAYEYAFESGIHAECHTGNGRQEISGTGVIVESGGTFECYGGSVEGRGFNNIYVWISHGVLGTGFRMQDDLYQIERNGTCSAVRAANGAKVTIYDGNFIGNAGAYAVEAGEKSDFSVYSGSFRTEDQQYYILGCTDYGLKPSEGYAKHVYMSVKANKAGLTSAMFPYGDEAVEIYEGQEKKDGNRVVLQKESKKEDEQGSVSATVTIKSGSQKVVKNAGHKVFDGEKSSYLVCPKSAYTTNIVDFTDAVSVTQSKVEYAMDTHCTLHIDCRETYFPENIELPDDSHFVHGLKNVEWQIRKKTSGGKWTTEKWDTLDKIVGDDGRSLDLYKALYGCEVGETYQIYARYTEQWTGKHKYGIETVAVTPEIVVVPTEKLCTHDWKLLSDTATCVSGGEATYVCTKCSDRKTEPSEVGEHNLIRTYNDYYCWDTCTTCGHVFNEREHNMRVVSSEVISVKTVREDLKCKYCDYQYSNVKECDCIHETSVNYAFKDETHHWTYCLKCGAKLIDEHHFVQDNQGGVVTMCEGSVIDGGVIGCTYYCVNGFIAPFSFSHLIVNDEYISLPSNYCQHIPLEIDYSHLSKENQAKSKKIVWTIEYSGDKPNRVVEGGDSIDLAKYGADGYSVTVEVTIGGTVFSAEAIYPHNAEIPAVEPTCHTDGCKKHWICSNCGKTVDSDSESSRVIDPTIPATGEHVYDNCCDTECNTCGACREAPHDWETVTDDSGNTSAVFFPCDEHCHAQHCRLCGETRDISDHNWVETILKSDCKSEGKVTYTCSDCGYKYESEITAPAGHTYTLTDYQSETCETEGHATYKCVVCGDTYTDTIPKLEHIPVPVGETPSSCVEHGAGAHFCCSVCGKLFTDAEGTNAADNVPELPCDPANHVHTDVYEYSFNMTHHWYSCECGTVLLSEEHALDASGCCTVCGYKQNEDLMLSEEEKKAGATIKLLSTAVVGSPAPVIEGYDGLPFRMVLACYWWVGLIVLAVIALIVTVVILGVKLKKSRRAAGDTNIPPENKQVE